MNPAKTYVAIGAILTGLASPAFAQGLSVGAQTQGSAQGSAQGSGGVGRGINSTLSGSTGAGGQVSAPGANVGVDGSASSDSTVGLNKRGGKVGTSGNAGGGAAIQLGR